MKPQELTITVKFLTEHKPATPEHLYQILKAYLEAKGITLKEDLTFDV